MLKIADASMMDHRRPKRAVKGQTKKQAKKADHVGQSHESLIGGRRSGNVPPACKRLVAFELISTCSAFV